MNPADVFAPIPNTRAYLYEYAGYGDQDIVFGNVTLEMYKSDPARYDGEREEMRRREREELIEMIDRREDEERQRGEVKTGREVLNTPMGMLIFERREARGLHTPN